MLLIMYGLKTDVLISNNCITCVDLMNDKLKLWMIFICSINCFADVVSSLVWSLKFALTKLFFFF